MRKTIFRISLITAAIALSAAAPALAQGAQGAQGACCAPGGNIGVRGGVTADPTGFFFGAHLESPPLTGSNRFSFRPNADIMFGDNQWALTGNMEFVFWLRFPNSPWATYFGGGPAAQYIKPDGFDGEVRGNFSGLVGFQHDNGLFIDFKSTGGTLKLGVGWIIQRR